MNVEDFAVPDLDNPRQYNHQALDVHTHTTVVGQKLDSMNAAGHHAMFGQFGPPFVAPEAVDPNLRGVHPQHFLPPGVPDLAAAGFPLTSASPAPNMFAPVHQQIPQVGPTDKPTPAQAAAGRLQRASARQAAKAAQQQKRAAREAARQAQQNTAGNNTNMNKRKAEVKVGDDGSDDSDDSDDEGVVPDGGDGKQPKPHEIARTKYNHVEDEKERKRLKRLLRNRVSAQQARERKKAYLSTLEDKHNDMEKKMAEMEAKINTLERENFMLRQVVKSTTQKAVPTTNGNEEAHTVPSNDL